ncbi:three-Cys-motif partner protein TcmP [Bradyrhizobium elkanii]|uniref:three-Cys-motif partner protein TcmP n=1 Tax=Bradyrhizobium elkanii TaxID=29448 RepID=UPI003D25E544
MAKKSVKVDPDDGLIVGEVGPWATEKHERLRKYIDAAGPTRAKYVPPKGWATASYIELYSGAGRSLIDGSNRIIDGSALVAYKAAKSSAMPFTDLHLSDLEQVNSDAVAQRIKALGGVAQNYHGPADKIVDRALGALNPHGLHLAFLDPFSLGQLPFSIIEKMLKFRRMDMIIHVSLFDLQRNLDDYSSIGSYAGFWVTRRSGGVVFRHLDDLDAVFESDTCDDLRQLICAFQPPPGL